MNYPIEAIRNDFPILSQQVHGKPLVYFDNGASTHKPRQVVEAMEEVAFRYNSNIHRGIHTLSNLCTEAFENARQTVASFIGTPNTHEVIFTRGTTESINLVAYSFGETFLQSGDEVIISGMEHHSNIVPWQLLQKRKGIVLKVIPVLDSGELDMDIFHSLISPRTRLVSVTHVSNVLGTINPIQDIIEIAHQHNIAVLIDGAQAVQHLAVDVKKLDCDFYAFSGHKLYGPTGIGVLYGKEKWLNQMVPYQGGGEMIQTVTFEETTFNELPYKFEAGTPNFTGAIGLAAAVKYLQNIGLQKIHDYEDALFSYAFEKLQDLGNIKFYGKAPKRGSLISFLLNGIHPFDAGTLLDKMGIAVRTGHHCAQPLMDRFKIPGTIRASFGLYNTTSEVDALVNGLVKVRQLFG